MPKFEVVSPYQPSGDQPEAIAALADHFGVSLDYLAGRSDRREM